MKTSYVNIKKTSLSILLIVLIFTLKSGALVAQVCSNPAGVVYGLTPTANIHPVTVSTGAVAGKLNPAYTGNVPDLANAMGYSTLNGRFYYFKRNTMNLPQEFVCYDPAANAIFARAASPITTVVNLGTMDPSGTGYYCIDALGQLFYYRVATNAWTTICTNIRDQFGTGFSTIISNGAIPTPANRVYGDMAFDGSGNLWILVSGPSDYGLYKMAGPLPTIPVASMTMTRILPPTTPSPGGQSFGGAAFNASGQMLLATNSGDNKLYRLENNLSLTYLTTMTLDGVGTDLTSCNFPLWVLAESWKQFHAATKTGNDVQLNWTVTEHATTKSYVIEHSSDGEHWNEIASLNSKRTDGESGYMLVHRNPTGAKNHYRIAQLEADGNKNYSQVKSVIFEKEKLTISLWPNPSLEAVQVSVNESDVDQNAKVLVFDQYGRQVKNAAFQKGINKIDVRALPAGTYVVRVEEPNGKFITGKFVKR